MKSYSIEQIRNVFDSYEELVKACKWALHAEEALPQLIQHKELQDFLKQVLAKATK